ncbi:Por secretion system C-terminal sorting domain-containing protein [Lishizhenia tianjinensis]|uniref:Por secretion system C-terminal sorting domain-containing protein n=1 Tax=Lishizhenia tianjinensis TaxID=477690 RepID=A0A1I6XD99_9FLAO|nr:T9SS type A sorting domain-containing protein [Lishizhenia tianjinensis]SFT35814.1 Por secretion system C-terminal sorting domain-containing protein [Lishizhenia tianjinensis]
MRRFYSFFLMLILLFFGRGVLGQTATTIPYFTGFENGLDGCWSTYVQSSNCEVAIYTSGTYVWSGSSADAYTGTHFLGLHNAVGGLFETTHAALHLDLAGESGLRFSFYLSEWNEEDHPQDGIYISDDGGTTYTEVFHYNGTQYTDLQYTHFDWSLDSINALYNLSFNSNYVIKVQQHDNFYFGGGNDGFLLDEVSVYEVCATASGQNVYLCGSGSYTVPSGDEIYTTPGSVTDTLMNSQGCDSVLYINLLQGNSSATMYEFSCTGSFTAPDGQILTTSGNYTITIPNAVGCDSVIDLWVIVGTPSGSHITVNSCGDYTAPDGQVYTSSGNYVAVIQNAIGCDSTIAIDLNITPNASGSETISSCGDFTWSDGNTYTTSGTYTQTLGASNGCDSIVTLDLTIDPELDVTIVSTDNVTLEGQGAVSYDWIDCATGNVVGTGTSFTATANGSYAAVGNDGPYCSDTSECFAVTTVGIDQAQFIAFEMYPNPTADEVYFEANANLIEVVVLAVDGREVLRSTETSLNVKGLAPATYLLEFTYEGDYKFTRRLIVE